MKTELGLQRWFGNITLFGRGLLRSYSQVFFSDNRVFAGILILVTFIDPYAGFYGLLSVIITNFAGIVLGFNKNIISKGLYGFNSLLVGLGLGIYFAPGWHLLLIVVLASVLTLFISIAAEGVLGKYVLPYLSIPFIISIWIITLATRDLTALGVSQRGVFTLNDLYQMGGAGMVNLYQLWNKIGIPQSLRVYFISLGAIFFQFNVLSGILIALGLLYYSRIAFSLSIIGFYSAFLFYEIVGANMDELNYSYIGFNYILTAIAVGGFFLIPSISSYLSVIFMIPLVALVTMSMSSVLEFFYLPVLSLPFNFVVILFLYGLKFRTINTFSLNNYFYQYNSPELNLYAFKNATKRFFYKNPIPVILPFYGEWTVTQSYDGEYTHKDDWRHALDFEIIDGSGQSYKGNGNVCNDYYCYGKTVLAPADGTVEEVVDGIDDNAIGEINIIRNWGNTIIIQHAEGLYSKLSHLQKDSLIVKRGEKIKKGQLIAKCGNSGRSPYPHLHFQMQKTPYIGSKTIDYPLSHFIRKNGKEFEFLSFSIPVKGDRIMNISTNQLFQNSLNFIPGRKFTIAVQKKDVESVVEWEVGVNIYNKPYIMCQNSGSKAWFENDGVIWYFTHFEGKRNSLLFYFYQAAYKIQQGFYQDIVLRDVFPINLIFPGSVMFFQDFIAPFYLFLKSDFRLDYSFIDNSFAPETTILKSKTTSYIFGKLFSKTKFELELNSEGIKELRAIKGGLNLRAIWQKSL